MITLVFETANIVEAPPAKCGSQRCLRGPGTRARVHLTLHGPEGTSQVIAIAGTTGEIFYAGQATGELTRGDTAGEFLYAVTEPFAAGRRVAASLAPAPPLPLAQVEKVAIGHDRDGPGPEWCLKSLQIRLADDRSFQFDCLRWLEGKDVELSATNVAPVLPRPDPAAPTQPIVPPPAPSNSFDSSVFDKASFS